MLTVVIPTLNESNCLDQTLSTLFSYSTESLEVIIADGGSLDGTVTIAAQYIQQNLQIIHCEPGRAKQMNAGATIATGDILCFLHADTQVPPNFDRHIAQCFPKTPVPPLPRGARGDRIAGAFNLKINHDRPLLRLVEWGVKLRSQLFQLPYGDQAIFLKKTTFDQLGGFPDLPIMEDFVLIRTLAKLGKIAIVPAAVTTSARRWEKQGILKTTWINQLMILGYYLGISPEQLRDWYRSP